MALGQLSTEYFDLLLPVIIASVVSMLYDDDVTKTTMMKMMIMIIIIRYVNKQLLNTTFHIWLEEMVFRLKYKPRPHRTKNVTHGFGYQSCFEVVQRSVLSRRCTDMPSCAQRGTWHMKHAGNKVSAVLSASVIMLVNIFAGSLLDYLTFG